MSYDMFGIIAMRNAELHYSKNNIEKSDYWLDVCAEWMQKKIEDEES